MKIKNFWIPCLPDNVFQAGESGANFCTFLSEGIQSYFRIIIPLIIPILLLLVVSACKITSNKVSNKGKGENTRLSKKAVPDKPQVRLSDTRQNDDARLPARKRTAGDETVALQNDLVGLRGVGQVTRRTQAKKTYFPEVLKKRGIKRKDDRIAVKKQKKVSSRATISDRMRKQMLRDAKRATKEERYEDAIKIAENILRERPNNTSALAIRENAQRLMEDKVHKETMSYLENINAKERNKYFENLKEKSIPYNDLMKYPTEDEWEDIKERVLKEDASERLDQSREHTERLQLIPSPSQKPVSQDIREKLNKKISLEFIDTPLSDVIALLQEKTNINFILDKGVADTSVSIRLNDVSISVVLGYLLPKGMDYVVKDNVIRITQEPLELRVYDVRDLLINLEDRQSLTAQVEITGFGEGAAPAGEGKDTFDRVQEIITLITSTIEPASWSVNGGRGMIAAREGMLGDVVVTHVQGVHRQVEGLLAALRSSSDLQVSIEARFIAVSDNFLETFGHNIADLDTTQESASKRRGIFTETGSFSDVGVGAASPVTSGLNLTYQIFDGFFLKGFLKAVQESDEAETLTAPKITLSNTQRGTIKVVTTKNFIESFTIVSQVPQPVIKQIDDGTTFNVRPVVSADRKYVYLEVHPVITTVTFETTEFQTVAAGKGGTEAGSLAKNTIQRPETVKQELSVTVCVPDTGILMIGGLGSRSETKTSKGVPILSKIPIVKRLFSSDEIDRDIATTGNLIILIKPTILIRDEQETRAFAKGKREAEVRLPAYSK